MTRYENAARMARDEARARRAVLIVTRTAYDAARIMTALEDVLRPRDGDARLLNGMGLWSAESPAWGTGRIAVRVAGPIVRGHQCDTLLLAADLTPTRAEEAWHCATGAACPVRARW